jgi:hypothetical protein
MQAVERVIPFIAKRLDLRLAINTILLFEQHIIAGVGIEWRVEINEVYALIRDILTQHT